MAITRRFRFQYAVKFICTSNIPGTSQQTPSFLPGSYATAVNIHNPNPRPVRFRMKLAMATSTEVDPPQITAAAPPLICTDDAERALTLEGTNIFTVDGVRRLAWTFG